MLIYLYKVYVCLSFIMKEKQFRSLLMYHQRLPVWKLERFEIWKVYIKVFGCYFEQIKLVWVIKKNIHWGNMANSFMDSYVHGYRHAYDFWLLLLIINITMCVSKWRMMERGKEKAQEKSEDNAQLELGCVMTLGHSLMVRIFQWDRINLCRDTW